MGWGRMFSTALLLPHAHTFCHHLPCPALPAETRQDRDRDSCGDRMVAVDGVEGSWLAGGWHILPPPPPPPSLPALQLVPSFSSLQFQLLFGIHSLLKQDNCHLPHPTHFAGTRHFHCCHCGGEDRWQDIDLTLSQAWRGCIVYLCKHAGMPCPLPCMPSNFLQCGRIHMHCSIYAH